MYSLYEYHRGAHDSAEGFRIPGKPIEHNDTNKAYDSLVVRALHRNGGRETEVVLQISRSE